MQEERDRLHTENKRIQNARMQLQAQVDHFSNKLDQTLSELDLARLGLTAHEKEIGLLKKECEDLKELVDDKEFDANIAGANLARAVEQREKANRQAAQLENTYAGVVAMNAQLNTECDNLVAENRRLLDQIHAIKQGKRYAEVDATRARKDKAVAESNLVHVHAQAIAAQERANAEAAARTLAEDKVLVAEAAAAAARPKKKPSLPEIMRNFDSMLQLRRKGIKLAKGEEFELPWALPDLLKFVGQGCLAVGFIEELMQVGGLNENGELRAFFVLYVIHGLSNRKATVAKLAISRLLVRRGMSTSALDTLARFGITLSRSGYWRYARSFQKAFVHCVDAWVKEAMLGCVLVLNIDDYHDIHKRALTLKTDAAKDVRHCMYVGTEAGGHIRRFSSALHINPIVTQHWLSRSY